MRTTSEGTTLENLRATDQFLNAAARVGADLDTMRREISARIVMHELHDIRPDLDVDSIAEEGVRFLSEVNCDES